MTFKFSNPNLRYIFDKFYKDHPEASKFEKTCDDFLLFLEALPKEADVTALSLKEYQTLLLEDHRKATEEFNKELNQNIKAIWIISSFKIYRLLNAILSLFEKEDFYSAITLIRTLVETTCFCNHRLSEISLIVKEANKNTHDFMEFSQYTAVLEDLLQVSRKGTKISVFLKEGTDTIEAERISDSIKYVSKQEKYNTLKRNYGLLCDFVHPNMLSNEIFGIPTRLYKKDDKEFIPEGIIMVRGEVDKYYRDIPKDAFILHVRFLGMLIKTIILCIDLFKETFEKYKDLHIEKCYNPVFDLINNMPEKERNKLKKEIVKGES